MTQCTVRLGGAFTVTFLLEGLMRKVSGIGSLTLTWLTGLVYRRYALNTWTLAKCEKVPQNALDNLIHARGKTTMSNLKTAGPVYILFTEVAKLPQGERKAALIPRLELLWETAMSRTYVSKGVEHHNPDCAVALKVVEAADHILGEAAASSTGKFAALRRFDTAPKKAAG